MRSEPKVMWSARLPREIVGQIADAAAERDVSQADLAEEVWGEWLDANSSSAPSQRRGERAHRGQTPTARVPGQEREAAVSEALAEQAAREAVERVEEFLCGRGAEPRKVIVCCLLGDNDGAVVGLSPEYVTNPKALVADTLEFATIAAGAAGVQLRVDMDDG